MRSDLQALLHKAPALLGHVGGSGVLLGTLGCLEFNLLGNPFPGWSTAASRQRVAELLLGPLRKMRRRRWVFEAEMKQLSFRERQLLVERGQITGAMAARQDGVYVLLNDSQDTECYINDEEHFLLKTFYPGAQRLEHAQSELSRLLADLCKKLPVAQDPVFGYLSCDPSKGGEALFFANLLHLPALRLARYMEQVQRALDEMGIFLSPVFSVTRKHDDGDMYLLHSPAMVTGKMSAALKTMSSATDAVCQHELHARAKLMEDPKSAARVEELIQRAFRVLTEAPKIKYRELLGAISALRLGLYYGKLQADAAQEEMDTLLSQAYLQNAPAHMIHLLGIAKQRERREARASYARRLVHEKLRVHASTPHM